MDLGTLGVLCWPLFLQGEQERDILGVFVAVVFYLGFFGGVLCFFFLVFFIIIFFFLICTEFGGASESWVSCPVTGRL